MSERKTLIERLAAQRESAGGQLASPKIPDAKPVQSPRGLAPLPLVQESSIQVAQTRQEIVRDVELVEIASITAHQRQSRPGSLIRASAVRWLATVAVVIAGVACFVLLPSSKNDAPVASGVIKPLSEPLKPAVKSAAEAVPPTIQPMAPIATTKPSSGDPSAGGNQQQTTITVTPVSASDTANAPKSAVVAKSAVVTKPKIAPRPILATASSKTQVTESNNANVMGTMPSAVMASPATEKSTAVKAPAAQTTSCGGSGLVAEQCQACSAKPWLSRLNCEAQVRDNYCSTREGKSADCPVSYNTRG